MIRLPQPAHSRGPPTPDAVLAAEATADDAAVGPAPCTDTAARPLGVCWSPAPWSVTKKRPQVKTSHSWSNFVVTRSNTNLRKYSGLLGYETVSICIQQSASRETLLPPSSGQSKKNSSFWTTMEKAMSFEMLVPTR